MQGLLLKKKSLYPSLQYDIMDKPKSKSAYADLLQEYNISKKHLYFILSEPDEKKVFARIKRSTKGLRAIRERHADIVQRHRSLKKI